MLKFVDTFEKHKNEPKKSLEDYLKELKFKLGQENIKKNKIYLDTKYWLYLRDYVLGRNKDSNIKRIYELLHQGTNTGKIICPISQAIFYEIMQQTDPVTFEHTIAIVDELSRGISIISSKERMNLELQYYSSVLTGCGNNLYSPDKLVWTKIPYVFGFVTPISKKFSEKVGTEIQKAFLDHMWSLSLTDIIKSMRMETILSMPRFNDISEQLSADKVKYSHQNNSFKKIFLAEVAGILNIISPELKELVINACEKKVANELIDIELNNSTSEEKFAYIIYNIIARNKVGSHLPTLVILAKLHASVRLDNRRKYHKNDLIDFQHAYTALPYYDYFFTERNLTDLIKRKNMNLEDLYQCKVFAKPGEVLESLKTICC